MREYEFSGLELTLDWPIRLEYWTGRLCACTLLLVSVSVVLPRACRVVERLRNLVHSLAEMISGSRDNAILLDGTPLTSSRSSDECSTPVKVLPGEEYR